MTKKKIYGHLPKHYPIPYREFIDIDYADKLTPEELAFLGRFEANRLGSRFLKDGFDVEGNDDEIRKKYMVDANHLRADVATAIRCGIPRTDIDGTQHSVDSKGVIVSSSPWATTSGYDAGGRNLVEDAMIALIDGDNEDE